MNTFRKLIKPIFGFFALLIIVIIGVTVWDRLEYFTPHPLIPHRKVTISLPFTPENDPTAMIPMGETIAHNFYGGHPGIDFQWTQSVPLIAVADGQITRIDKTKDMGDPVFDATLKAGEYLVQYKELENVVPGVKNGTLLKKGEVIGYPHCVVRNDLNNKPHTSCQLHWEFGYARFSPGFERLCPLSYFDTQSQIRIKKLWESVPENNQFKRNAPNICSNIYLGRDQ